MPRLQLPDCPNVSLVAFYGDKPPELSATIAELHERLSASLSGNFHPYRLAQIHATAIGCEGVKTDGAIVGKWFLERRGEVRSLELDRFILYARRFPRVRVRFGGYDRATDYGFLSRQRHPAERSFQFQGNLAVLVGWIEDNGTFPATVDRFRRGAQAYNLLHKFHDRPETFDNDIYLRLGGVRQPLAEDERDRVEREIREFLSARPPVEVPLTPEQLAFVGYRDLCLTPETTTAIALSQVRAIDLEALYPEI
ncbi:MAG: hypothetical protein D6680_22375 [Cyanobacteria bacterium J007]|jgi:hypothetical protein|nr:MAG: hypothetical protein D6680_22375 [Cyanobacteria bacterium J007]